MDYRIVDKPAFGVAGKALRVSTKDGENMRRIPQLWDECHADGSLARLRALAADRTAPGDVILGICMDFAADMKEFTYMIAAEAGGEGVPEGMVEKAVPALTYAVFEVSGPMPEAIQTVWGRIRSEFFPSGEYVHAVGPDIEVYPPGDPEQPGYRSEVWVPVVKN